MNNKIQDAFSSIHAKEELKRNTINALYEKQGNKRTKNTFIRPIIAFCAMFFVILSGIGIYNFYTLPVSYISIDINPSIELSLNRMDYVVKAHGYNEDGTMLLQNLDLENKPYTEAIELLLADETFGSYMSNDALLSFTVVSPKEETLLIGIQHCKGYSQTQSQCHSADPTMRNEARKQGISFGKYQAFLELSQYDESVTIEHCKELSMRQIQDLIDDACGEKTISGNSSSQGHHGDGQGKRHRKG